METTNNSRLVELDIAHLEGRKLLAQPVGKIIGVSDLAAKALNAHLKIISIFDLAMSRIFNGVNDLVDPSGLLPMAYTRHDFVPADLIRGDPKDVASLDALLQAEITELNLPDDAVAALKAGLVVNTIRDLAFWPPFRAARQILLSTFNPTGLEQDDPEAPAALIPTTGNFATERVYYGAVVMTSPPQESSTKDLEAGAVNLTGHDEEGYTKPAPGALITIEQAWYAKGVTLGHLLHSLTLAPGESTKVAVVDWARRTSGQQREDTNQLERLASVADQTRALSEVSHGVAQEVQHGSSTATTSTTSTQLGTSGGLFAGMLGFSGGMAGNAGIVTSVATSTGSRDVAASLVQNINERTQQHANSARSRRAAIVQEAAQAEHEVATTRVVTNYNHMHALTIQYYEVLQAYRVVTKAVRYERLLFVPFQPIDFSAPEALEGYRQELVFAARAREEGLGGRLPRWSDLIACGPTRALAAGEPGMPEPRTSAGEQPDVAGAALLDVTVKCLGKGKVSSVEVHERGGALRRKQVTDGRCQLDRSLDDIDRIEIVCDRLGETLGLTYRMRLRNGEEACLDQQVEPTGSRGWVVVASPGAEGERHILKGSGHLPTPMTTSQHGLPPHIVDAINLGNVRPQIDRFALSSIVAQCDVGKIFGLRLKLRKPMNGENYVVLWESPSGDQKAAVTDQTFALGDIESIQLNWEVRPRLRLEYVLSPPGLKEQTSLTLSHRDAPDFRVCVAKVSGPGPLLVKHLNDNRTYYTTSILLSRGSLELSRALAGYRYRDKPLLSSIELRPVAVTSNYVAFRWSFDDSMPEKAAKAEFELGVGKDSSKPTEAEVSLPTGGIFAEAVLGRSNAAEKLDLTRFWDWQESPIPILPPDIAPVGMGTRAQPMNLATHELEAQAAQLQQLGKLPDPSGMQMIGQVLTTNLFNDMSHAAETTKGLIDALGLTKDGAKSASADSLAAYKAAMEHQQEMARMTLDAAKTFAVPEAGAADALVKLGGGGAVTSSGISRVGAIMNAAGKLDATQGGGSDNQQAALYTLTGGVRHTGLSDWLVPDDGSDDDL